MKKKLVLITAFFAMFIKMSYSQNDTLAQIRELLKIETQITEKEKDKSGLDIFLGYNFDFVFESNTTVLKPNNLYANFSYLNNECFNNKYGVLSGIYSYSLTEVDSSIVVLNGRTSYSLYNEDSIIVLNEKYERIKTESTINVTGYYLGLTRKFISNNKLELYISPIFQLIQKKMSENFSYNSIYSKGEIMHNSYLDSIVLKKNFQIGRDHLMILSISTPFIIHGHEDQYKFYG